MKALNSFSFVILYELHKKQMPQEKSYPLTNNFRPLFRDFQDKNFSKPVSKGFSLITGFCC